jgi:hypothetical protein
MKKDEVLFDEDRGHPNHRSTQTKSSISTTLKNEGDTNNSISKTQEELLSYFAANSFRLNKKRELVNPIQKQIENGLNFIVIPIRFFKHDKQIWMWIIKTPNKEKEFHIIAALEELFGKGLSNR